MTTSASAGVDQIGLVLLLTSPRVAPGLMTRSAWQAVEAADVRLALDLEDPLAQAVLDADLGVDTPAGYAGWSAAVVDSPADTAPQWPGLARHLVTAATGARVAWLGSADGDVGLTDAIAAELSRLPEPPPVEVVVGSWDPPGARLLDVVAVMDRLRSPGGCPWDAQQTHDSLLPYLTEESEEFAEAVRSGDREHMAEELGDVLLQVAFHARVAAEDLEQPFDIDDVAGLLVDKLVRRHPHVFADGQASTPEEVEANWARIKEQEQRDKREREHREHREREPQALEQGALEQAEPQDQRPAPDLTAPDRAAPPAGAAGDAP